MIAYNKNWLDALFIKENAGRWQSEGLISNEQLNQIKANYPSPFYSPNLFVRIGLAFFCFILLLAGTGLIGIFVGLDSAITFGAFSFLVSGGCFLLLEKVVIDAMRHRGSGVDDMLAYTVAGAAISGLWALLNEMSNAEILYSFTALIVLVPVAIRYADKVLTAAAFLAGYVLIYQIFEHTSPEMFIGLPLTWMFYTAATYFFATRSRKKYELRYWDGAFATLELFALAGFYAAGNYLAVHNFAITERYFEYVPMGWFYWIFTFIVPLGYLFFGLRNKSRMMLDMGIAVVAVAIFTYRSFYAVMPLPWAATIGGAVLFIVAWLSIRFLNAGRAPGYAYAEDGEKTFLQEAEEQLIEQTIGSHAPPSSAKKEGEMGGGQFSGGGAGGEF